MKIITISGASGSGKSTLAAHLEKQINGGLLLSLDRYYLSKKEQLDRNGYFNFDDPASIEIELLKEHLNVLSEYGEASVPVYNFKVSERAGYEKILAKDVIIIDGLFPGALLEKETDFSIYVDVDLNTARERRIKRDMVERGRTLESIIEQFESQVKPAYFDFIEPIKQTSDLIIENNNDIEKFLENSQKVIKQFT